MKRRRFARRLGGAAAAAAAAAMLLAGGGAAPAAAQGAELADRCPADPGAVGGSGYCPRVAHAVGIMQPRFAVLAAGGNPVPGTASTLGTRLGSLPRFSTTGRVSAVTMQIPGVTASAPGASRGNNSLALSADVAVGVLPGMPLLPTVGGFGSVDALASMGFVRPGGGAFARGTPFTWAGGARVGIVRESFTMPGLSVSGMYRRIGTIEYGDPSLERYPTHFTLDRTRVLSMRAAASKRLFMINATAGLGWDRTTSAVSITVREPPLPAQPTARHNGFRSDRSHLFVNAAWTTLILNFVGEVGVQGGGDGARAPDTVRGLVERRGVYGSVAARIAI